jgi:hypothetical protein
MDQQKKCTYLLKGDIMEMSEIKVDAEQLFDIRKQMWTIYNREKSINDGATELINIVSEALVYQLAINAGHIKFINEISKKLDSLVDIQEPNDGKGQTG